MILGLPGRLGFSESVGCNLLDGCYTEHMEHDNNINPTGSTSQTYKLDNNEDQTYHLKAIGDVVVGDIMIFDDGLMADDNYEEVTRYEFWPVAEVTGPMVRTEHMLYEFKNTDKTLGTLGIWSDELIPVLDAS